MASIKARGVVVFYKVVKSLLRDVEQSGSWDWFWSVELKPHRARPHFGAQSGGKGWPIYLMALPAWLQGLFREFLYEGDILAYPTWIFSSWSGTVARAG